MGKYIAAGDCHSAALNDKGQLFTFGCNILGACGFEVSKETEYIKLPKIVKVTKQKGNEKEVEFSSVACGDTHTLSLSTEGDVYSFGWNGFGCCARNDEQKSSVCRPNIITCDQLSSKVVQLAVGASHCVILSEQGTAFSFGNNAEYATAIKLNEKQPCTNMPTSVTLPSGASLICSSVYCGSGLSFFVCGKTGNVYVVGNNEQGQAACSPQTVFVQQLTRIDLLKSFNIDIICASSSHCVALVSDK